MAALRPAAEERSLGVCSRRRIPSKARSLVRVRLRVLIVDDDMLLRWSVAEALGSCGHTVIVASDATAALRALAHAVVDAVLLDYESSERHLLPVLAMVRALSPAAALVLTTAFPIEALDEQAQALGAAAVLHKPFDVFGIEPVLRQVCEARSR